MRDNDWNAPRSYRLAVLVFLAVWLGIVLIAASAGLFGPGRIPPPAAAAVPLIVFTLSVALSRGFREYVLSLDVRTLTFLQAWRVIGFGFVIGGVYQILPNSFARPAGWGDVLVGFTAPLAASISRGRIVRERLSLGSFSECWIWWSR